MRPGAPSLIAASPSSFGPPSGGSSCLRAACGGTTVSMVREKHMRLIIAFCVVFLFDLPAARAQDVAGFYRGKQLRFVVGSAVGGAYDLYARALARQIVHYIPG